MIKKDNAIKSKRWLIRIIVITSSISVAVFTLYGLDLIKGLSLSYVDDLKHYQNKFSPIVGAPSHITKEEYFKKRELEKEVLDDIFPELSPNEGVFYYHFAETIKPYRNYEDRWEIYVCCRWDYDDYRSEKEKLSLLTGFNGRTPLLSNDLFSLPSYVFVYTRGRFKYALFDDETKSIYYISLAEIGNLNNVVFDHSLAPQKRLQDSDLARKTRNGEYIY